MFRDDAISDRTLLFPEGGSDWVPLTEIFSNSSLPHQPQQLVQLASASNLKQTIPTDRVSKKRTLFVLSAVVVLLLIFGAGAYYFHQRDSMRMLQAQLDSLHQQQAAENAAAAEKTAQEKVAAETAAQARGAELAIQRKQEEAKQRARNNLRTVMEALRASENKSLYGMALLENTDGKPTSYIKDPNEIPSVIALWLRTFDHQHFDKGRLNLDDEDFRLITQHQQLLNKLFSDLNDVLGKRRILYFSLNGLPLRFATQDSDIVLIASSLVADKVYNTLKTTARSRAKSATQSMILPVIPQFTKNLTSSGIQRFGVVAAYPFRNFVSDKSWDTKQEQVALVTTVSLANKFVNGEVTEDEFLDRSDIYLSDADMGSEFKKIKLSAE